MVEFRDTAIIDGAARITRDGYFVAEARVAQADNVQDYLPHELGLEPKADGTPYRIGRPRAAVFDAAAKASLAHRPITITHPKEDVTASNWKRVAVGDVGDTIIEDGNFLRVPLKLMDSDAIRAARTTHREFSLGYSAELDMTPQTIGDAQVDGVITSVRYNHLALVPAARGGPELRIIDERPAHLRDHQETEPMKIKIGDAEVDATNGEAVKVAVQALDAKLATLSTTNETLTKDLGDAKAKIATLETEKATLTQQLADATLTPEKLRDAAKSYADTQAKAKALGVAITDSMGEAEIRKAVVDAKMGDAAQGWDEKQIAASFAVLTKDAKVEQGAAPSISGSPVNLGDAATLMDQSWAKANDDLNAWRAA